jgi:predicted patatin/cPLA2 family phospholipase
MSELQIGLVLEGGGLRGVYTSGVLRYFSDQGLDFPYVLGVSMGACNAANFVARQPERNRIVNIRYVRDRRYLSLWRWLCRGELFGMDFIFETIPNRLVPFAWERFLGSKTRCLAGVTDCLTSQPIYYSQHQLGREYIDVLRASSSLPFIAKPVRYQGRDLLDGGISDPIPVDKCCKDGYPRQVLVLTQPSGYRKEAFKALAWARWRYPHFPGLIKALQVRHDLYNENLARIDGLEQSGRAFVIRPKQTLEASRVERNKDKLYRVYDTGYNDAEGCWPGLAEFLDL